MSSSVKQTYNDSLKEEIKKYILGVCVHQEIFLCTDPQNKVKETM